MAGESSGNLAKLQISILGLGEGPRLCISYKLSGEAVTSGQVHTLCSEDLEDPPRGQSKGKEEGSVGRPESLAEAGPWQAVWNILGNPV